MQKYIFAIFALTLLIIPGLASAHERQLINIGGTDYLFVVGSLGEPLIVDDKSGVDFRVQTADPKDPTNSSAPGAKPVLGLEQTLKVEIIAGEKKKIFDLTTVYGALGSYKAVFFPTIQTALTYRFTGTMNNTPIDLSFPCAPEGAKAVEDKSETQIGDGVTRKYKNGQFGCPLAKESLGFPEESSTLYGMHESIHEEMEKMAANAGHQGVAALAFAILGIILGALALQKIRSSKV